MGLIRQESLPLSRLSGTPNPLLQTVPRSRVELWVNKQRQPCCRNTTKATRHKIGTPCLFTWQPVCGSQRALRGWGCAWEVPAAQACLPSQRDRQPVWRVICQWVIAKKSNSLKGWSTHQGQDASHGHVDASARVCAFKGPIKICQTWSSVFH